MFMDWWLESWGGRVVRADSMRLTGGALIAGAVGGSASVNADYIVVGTAGGGNVGATFLTNGAGGIVTIAAGDEADNDILRLQLNLATNTISFFVGAERLGLNTTALFPTVDRALDFGFETLRAGTTWTGGLSLEVSTIQDDTTYGLIDEGHVEANAAVGAVNLDLPPSVAGNTGETWFINVTSVANAVTLRSDGTDTINGGAAGADDAFPAVGLYIVICRGNGDTSSHGPIAAT